MHIYNIRIHIHTREQDYYRDNQEFGRNTASI
jgi:hypothetical protein